MKKTGKNRQFGCLWRCCSPGWRACKTGTPPKKAPCFDAHDTGIRYHFTDTDMDFNFGTLVLGSDRESRAVEIGEAFYAASRIKDGDAASWQQEWYLLAQRVEARGLQALADGHKVSARDQLQRASYYYRISLLAILPDDPPPAGAGRRKAAA